MGFNPINEDHAVAFCSAAFRLSVPLDNEGMRKVANNIENFREILPAVRIVSSEDIEFEPLLPVKHDDEVLGIEFSRFRPDGTKIWLFRIFGDELYLRCSRYTRWAEFRAYIEFMLDCCGYSKDKKEELPFQIEDIALEVMDLFVDEDFDREELSGGLPLKPSAFIPKIAISASFPSAFDVRWFERTPDFTTKHFLALETQVLAMENFAKFSIHHCSEVRYLSDQLKENNSPASVIFSEDGVLEILHQRNKTLLAELISEQLVEKVGLKGGGNEQN